MIKDSFHQVYAQINEKNTPKVKRNPKEDGVRFLSTETNPRILSMLRFEIKHEEIKEIRDLSADWPFLSLAELVELSAQGLINCVNIEQLQNYLDSWNGIPMDNAQAEADLTTARVEPGSNGNLFTLVPISVKRYNQTDYDGQDRYLLLHFDEEVLSPGEPTSTRAWLNALVKYYDFEGKSVAEVFAGSAPAAVIARIGGAKFVDSYEINPQAVEVARKNYKLYNDTFGFVIKSDVWSEGSHYMPEGGYDYVLANPPFNPKLTGSSLAERLIEMVQDEGYQTIIKFLKGLPKVLKPDGKAIFLYEDLPVVKGLDQELNSDDRNALEILAEQLNIDPNFPYLFQISQKIRIRRYRGEDIPPTTYVVYEITCQKK